MQKTINKLKTNKLLQIIKSRNKVIAIEYHENNQLR